MVSILTTPTERDTRKLLEVMNMFITFIMMIASQVYAHVQTYQIVYIRHTFFLHISYISVSWLK